MKSGSGNRSPTAHVERFPKPPARKRPGTRRSKAPIIVLIIVVVVVVVIVVVIVIEIVIITTIIRIVVVEVLSRRPGRSRAGADHLVHGVHHVLDVGPRESSISLISLLLCTRQLFTRIPPKLRREM